MSSPPVVAVPGAGGSDLVASALSVYTPPPCVSGVPFDDITCSTGFDAWIEQFARDGITAGCGGGNYCPGATVTRDQMAVFIEKAMRGTGSWPPHVAYAWAVKNDDGSPNPAASGDALLAALASIPTSGNDAPSATNPWLLQVGPGVFDLGGAQLGLHEYVSLVGAGMDATILRGGGPLSSPAITCSGNGEVASLSAIHTAATTGTLVIILNGPTRLDHVAVAASGGSGFNVAVLAVGGTSVLTATELTASGGGTPRALDVEDGTVIVRGGTLSASGGSDANQGVAAFGADADVFDAVIDATTPATSSSGSISIAGSQLGSGSVGTVTCAGVYDMSFGFHASTCP